MSRPAIRHVVGIIAALLVAAGIGLLAGRVAVSLTLALAVLLAFEVRNLLRFERWLRHKDAESPPDITGLWGEVVASTSRLHRRKLFHEQRVTALLREFRRMASAIPDGVVLLTRAREISWVNAAAGRWLGLNRKGDRGMRVDNIVRHPVVIAYLEDPDGHPPPRVQMPGQDERWLEFHLVRNPLGEQQLLLVRDVTSEARVDAMRKDFVANASHELRSPLTVIGGYLDAMEDDATLDTVWREPVAEMRRQSDRMRGIVEDLLELSRLEARGGPAEKSPVDVAGLLAALRKEVLAQPEPAPPIEVGAQPDAFLLGSETELHSIASNLVWNAVKYTPPSGSIVVRWWADARGGHLSVKDTGIGIPAEHLPRLTERFYRVDAGRSRKLGGSGLGLSIVKHALQRHDAWLEVESIDGKGSNFTCHFPAARISRVTH
ncbi:MAG: phosphate regulon sensor histidine kinase PhoR [Steroidobacteraceae bacterium]|nr:phosphate regulon sensor histidine kinase PhoR [Steroidobacteraceae bacterium]